MQHVEDLLLKERRDHSRADIGHDDVMLPLDALEKSSPGFALLGTAGSGKTTAFRYLALQAARGRTVKGKRRIPIYLAVRELDPAMSLNATCIRLLTSLGFDPADRILQVLQRTGQLMLLVDGLDETSDSHQKALVKELKEMQSQFDLSQVCLSGRHHSLSLGLEGFTKWETLPMSFPSRLEFIDKWFSVVNPAKGHQLVKQSSERPELLDLGSSPLLLSIVCALFSNDLDIPSDIDELFERSVHGMLGGWDAFRAIARTSPLQELSIRKRTILVSALAYYLFVDGKVAFRIGDAEDVRKAFRDNTAIPDVSFDTEAIITTLANDFGILVERAPNI
jgi:predicted NACHT family NTPase